MAHLIELPNMRDGYVTLVDAVIREGDRSAPRGLPIIELNDVTFTVADLGDTLPMGVGRKPNTVVAALEALQLIGEVSVPDLLVHAAPQFTNYREPEGHFHGAYGNRVGSHDQVWHVVDKLTDDRDSRQAVVTLWDPGLDNQRGKRDYPCTIALGFRIRNNRLDLSVVMRSNDVWLGVAYDVFQFTQLQWTVAHELEVEPGRYTHTAWSLHAYERDLLAITKLHPPGSGGDRPELPRGVPPSPFIGADEIAAQLLATPETIAADLTRSPDVSWYLERVMRARGDGVI